MNRLRDSVYAVSYEAGMILVAYVALAFAYILAMLYAPLWVEELLGVLTILCLVTGVVALVGLAMRKEMRTFAIVLFTGGVLFVLSLLFIGVAGMTAPDKFASTHPIPKGMTCFLPADEGDSPLVDEAEPMTYLQLWNHCQGGIYKYDFYYPALPAGTVFLRCYEAGKNVPLSEEDSGRSLSVVTQVGHPATEGFGQLVSRRSFTIYEGDWQDYYAARVEVWHTDSLTGESRKLMEKIYRVEGWMR